MALPWPMPVCSATLKMPGSVTVAKGARPWARLAYFFCWTLRVRSAGSPAGRSGNTRGLPRSCARGRCQPLPPLWSRTATPGQTPPALPRATGPPLAMVGLNPCASPPPRRFLTPSQVLYAPTLRPPLTLPRPRTILPDQPNCRTHKGKLSHDRRAEPTGTASQPHPTSYNPQGS